MTTLTIKNATIGGGTYGTSEDNNTPRWLPVTVTTSFSNGAQRKFDLDSAEGRHEFGKLWTDCCLGNTEMVSTKQLVGRAVMVAP